MTEQKPKLEEGQTRLTASKIVRTRSFSWRGILVFSLSLTLFGNYSQSMASSQKTISGKPQTEEPQEYEKVTSIIPQRPHCVHTCTCDRTSTRQMTALSNHKFAEEYKQGFISTPNLPLRSYSALSSTSILRDSALPTHEGIEPEKRSLSTVASSEAQNDDSINCVPVTPAHLMKKKYRRRYFMYAPLQSPVTFTTQALTTRQPQTVRE